ncbi:MAG: NAD(P)-dependent oxidoreductase [Thermosphaera sp.]
MKVTVTGATGFLGARVIEKLVSRGYSVKGTYHSRSKKILEEKNVKPVYMDLNEPSTFHEVVKDSDVIIHLAAYYTFTGKKKLYYKLNVEATKILAELALKQGISRFIYCSSTEAIGPVENPPGNEDTPPKPQFEYGRSKLLAEREVEKLGLQGLSYTIIRPSGLYGPGNIDDVSYWFITSFANRSLLSKFKIGRGDTLIQFSHVDDAAEGFILALDKLDKSENQTFIVSEDKAYTYNEVYQILSDITGNPPPRYSLSPRVSKLFLSFTHLYSLLSGTSNLLMRVSIVDSVTRHRAYSIEKAKRLLGFSPRYNLRKGLEETIMWYKSKGYIK